MSTGSSTLAPRRGRLVTTLRHGRRLAMVDVVRALRTATGSRVKLASSSLLLVVGVAWFGFMTYVLADDIAAGESLAGFSAIEVVRGVVGLFVLFVTFVSFVRTVGQRGTLAEAEGVLTVVTTRDALLGVLLAELSFLLLFLLPASFAVGVGLAVGGGFYSALVLAPVVFTGIAVFGVAVGYPIGLAVRHLVTRIPFVARHRNAFIALIFVAYLGLLVGGRFEELVVDLFEPLQSAPVSGFADLLFLATPAVDASATVALVAVGLTGVVAVLSVVVSTALAERHWFADPVLAGESAKHERSTPVGESRLQEALTAVSDAKTAALVTLAWRRAVRAPIKLLYAAYPLFLLGGFAPTIFESGTVPQELPLVLLLIVTWGAGVAFALNPFGDQGSVLPATLLSAVDGRTFVRATALASLLVAIPLGLVVTAATASLSPLTASQTLVLLAATPLVITLSTVVAVAIGMVSPRFTAVTVTRSTKAVIPSLTAFVAYTLYLGATALAGVLVADELWRTLGAALLSWLLPFGLSVTPETLYWVAGVVLVPLVIAPVAAYRFATRRFDSYVLG